MQLQRFSDKLFSSKLIKIRKLSMVFFVVKHLVTQKVLKKNVLILAWNKINILVKAEKAKYVNGMKIKIKVYYKNQK